MATIKGQPAYNRIVGFRSNVKGGINCCEDGATVTLDYSTAVAVYEILGEHLALLKGEIDAKRLLERHVKRRVMK